jgi:hypothetical protein
MFEGHCEQFSNPRFVCDLVSCLATTGFSSADVTGLPNWVRALAGIIMDAAVDSGITLASTQGISYNVAMFTSTLMISSGLLSLLRPWRARVHRGDADGETLQTPTELMIAAAILDHAWMIRKLLRKFRLDVNTTDDMGTALFHAVQNGHTNTAWTLLRDCASDPSGHALSARPERRIAFAMAMHRRLGRDSRASAMPPELLETVLSACRDPSDVLSTVDARAGHADTTSRLEWLEGLEKHSPCTKT